MSFFFKQIFKNARDKVLKGSVADRPVPLVPKRSTGKTTYMREENYRSYKTVICHLHLLILEVLRVQFQ